MTPPPDTARRSSRMLATITQPNTVPRLVGVLGIATVVLVVHAGLLAHVSGGCALQGPPTPSHWAAIGDAARTLLVSLVGEAGATCAVGSALIVSFRLAMAATLAAGISAVVAGRRMGVASCRRRQDATAAERLERVHRQLREGGGL